jgi:RHS repeat-associated protein
MLARAHWYSGSTGNWSTHNHYHADAGGNITSPINTGQSITAIYRYDPFGRTLFQSGTMANANLYRFSSKEVHGFTGMYYYGFRFYDPGLQRWINRDPIGERYDKNLYRFVNNSPFVFVDPRGAWGVCFGDWCIGRGDPTLAFNRDTLGDMAEGAYATIDGAMPLIDPFADRGYYDPCDKALQGSQLIGVAAREFALTAAGAQIASKMAGAAHWAKVPLPLKGYAARAWPKVALQNSTSPGVYAAVSGLQTGVNAVSLYDTYDKSSNVFPILPTPPPFFGTGDCP